MFHQRDYIRRLIEQVAAAIAHALALRRRGKGAEAAAELESVAAGGLGVDLKLVAAVEPALLAVQIPEPARLAALAAAEP